MAFASGGLRKGWELPSVSGRVLGTHSDVRSPPRVSGLYTFGRAIVPRAELVYGFRPLGFRVTPLHKSRFWVRGEQTATCLLGFLVVLHPLAFMKVILVDNPETAI